MRVLFLLFGLAHSADFSLLSTAFNRFVTPETDDTTMKFEQDVINLANVNTEIQFLEYMKHSMGIFNDENEKKLHKLLFKAAWLKVAIDQNLLKNREKILRPKSIARLLLKESFHPYEYPFVNYRNVWMKQILIGEQMLT